MKISFENDARWDSTWYSMMFHADADGRRIRCLISGEALQKYFGASDRQISMIEAFLRNRPAIESITRAVIERGRVDESGRVLILGADVAACA